MSECTKCAELEMELKEHKSAFRWALAYAFMFIAIALFAAQTAHSRINRIHEYIARHGIEKVEAPK